jgi:two-component system chemotaxis response regulator CheB
MKILIAEDDPTSGIVLERCVLRGGHQARLVTDGQALLDALKQDNYDAVLVDLVMPGIDGVSAIKELRATLPTQPAVIVTTALNTAEARASCQAAGADDFITKPYDPKVVLKLLEWKVAARVLAPRPLPRSNGPASGALKVPLLPGTAPKNIANPVVLISVGAGERSSLMELFGYLRGVKASFVVIMRGTGVALESAAGAIGLASGFKVETARQGRLVEPGFVLLGPQDSHIEFSATRAVKLNQNPPVNLARPSADVMFRSASMAFGRDCLAVVLGGAGRDGASGALTVFSFGGGVYVQDPSRTVSPETPNVVLKMGFIPRGQSLKEIGAALAERVSVKL